VDDDCKPLTPRQALFVAEYLKDLNATKAAIRAGYSAASAHSCGPRLLENADVATAIASAIERRSQRVEIKADDILRELYRLATVDLGGAIDQATGRLLPLHEMPEDVRRAISSIETEELWEGRGEDRERLGDLVKVKFWDKKAALELLGKHVGIFVDRSEVTLKSALSDVETAELKAALKK
jgi:phage terminase small subunit